MKMVFTTGQVAKICKVAPRTVIKWFDAGKLKGYKIPGSNDRRIPREALIRFLTEHGMPLGELSEEPQQWEEPATPGVPPSPGGQVFGISGGQQVPLGALLPPQGIAPPSNPAHKDNGSQAVPNQPWEP
jgi:excisionase family DNA binding protein